jgi:hypothetical protein
VGFGRFWGRRLRGRACALPLVGLDGCEVRLCDPCVRESRVCPGSLPPVFLNRNVTGDRSCSERRDLRAPERPLLCVSLFFCGN